MLSYWTTLLHSTYFVVSSHLLYSKSQTTFPFAIGPTVGPETSPYQEYSITGSITEWNCPISLLNWSPPKPLYETYLMPNWKFNVKKHISLKTTKSSHDVSFCGTFIQGPQQVSMCSQVKKMPNMKWEIMKNLGFICSLILWHYDFRGPQFLLIAYFYRIHFIYRTVATFSNLPIPLS